MRFSFHKRNFVGLVCRTILIVTEDSKRGGTLIFILQLVYTLGFGLTMATSPDPDIRFRRDERDKDAHTEGDEQNFEDANDTLEGQGTELHAHGHGDMPRDEEFARNRGILDFNGGYQPFRTQTLAVKPEPYDGGDDWEEYISHFEVCAELGRWRETDKVLALAAALRGPARTFYISLEQAEKRNYAILTQKLGSRFGSTRQQNRWLSRLEMRKRQSGESVAALADDLRQMAQRAYIDLDGRAQEVLALNQLYKSVAPEVKYQCTNQGCKTVAEAVEVIERYEAILRDGTDKKRGSVRMTDLTSSTECSGTDKDTILNDRLNGLTRRVSQLQDNKAPNNYRQNNFSQNNFSRPKPTGNVQNLGRRDVKCFICDSPNHICRNCPYFLRYKRENEDAKKNAQVHIGTGSRSINQGNFSSPLTQ